MNKYIRYSLLITLALLITVSLVKAQNPPIGQSPQKRPYESNPTAVSFFDVGAVLTSGTDAMKDGSLLSSGDFALGAPHVLRPNGDSAVAGRQAWTVSPVGLLHYFAWKEETSDADSTYLSAAATLLHELSTLEDSCWRNWNNNRCKSHSGRSKNWRRRSNKTHAKTWNP